jgi:hypothetical protein
MGLSIVSGFLLALSLSQCISAQDNHEWIAPTATDVRSPCPGLNTSVNFTFFRLYSVVDIHHQAGEPRLPTPEWQKYFHPGHAPGSTWYMGFYTH